MNEKTSDHGGRFVKRKIVQPAIEVDCSSWGSDLPLESRQAGKLLVRKQTGPAIEVDARDWGTGLQLTFQLDPQASAVQAAFGMHDLHQSVSQFHLGLSGVGLRIASKEASNGTVTLKLSPENAAASDQSVAATIDALNQGTVIPIPAGLLSVHAQVA